MELVLKSVEKLVRKKYLLKNVSATFSSGKIYGITGANGSGKTMLLRAICGFIRLSQGTIKLDEQSIVFNQSLPVETGLIIETPGFYPQLSGYQNLLALAAIKKQTNESSILNYMEKFKLLEHKDTLVKEYSLGMKQKLAIIQAIMENQSLILLDEPTNGLDKESVEVFHEVLQELKAQQKIVLLVSHHNSVLETICDVLYEMKSGELERLT